MSDYEDVPYTNHEARWVCSNCTEPVGALDFCPICVLRSRDRLRARNEVLEKYRECAETYIGIAVVQLKSGKYREALNSLDLFRDKTDKEIEPELTRLMNKLNAEYPELDESLAKVAKEQNQ